MGMKDISPDQAVLWQWGFVQINSTLVYSWIVMLILLGTALILRRRLTSDVTISGLQNAIEIIIQWINGQIRAVMQQDPLPYLPFIGTLFLYILCANLIEQIPGMTPPTASLSMTAGLALIVFVAVPVYTIRRRGVLGYLKHFGEPAWVVLPFQLLSEVTRSVAMAIRLFGNMMSGVKLSAIFLVLVPVVVPVAIKALGLIVAVLQAYIFTVLALSYIASASRTQGGSSEQTENESNESIDAPNSRPQEA